MSVFVLFSILISLAALFSYINIKWLRLPSGIALMLMGAMISIGIVVAGRFSTEFTSYIRTQLLSIDFSEFVLGILLSFLLFAGSLHVSYQQLKKSAKSILCFSTIGVFRLRRLPVHEIDRSFSDRDSDLTRHGDGRIQPLSLPACFRPVGYGCRRNIYGLQKHWRSHV